MARIRALKPDFFDDEDLAEHTFWIRILFEGLWCHADREGRLEDRPLRLKAKIFPYDNVDIAHGLDVLTEPKKHSPTHKSFIIRYSVNGENYLQIVEFSKHQSPHHTEKESVIPAPNGVLTVKEPLDKGEGGDAHSPKSMNLIHESLEGVKGEILTTWNEFAGKWQLPVIQDIKTGSVRARQLLARMKEKGFDFKALLQKIEKQPFLLGKNDKAWTITFDWILCPSNYTKIMEEQYPARISRDEVVRDRRVGASKKPVSPEEKEAQEKAKAEFQAKGEV